jgi:hypothetical protein
MRHEEFLAVREAHRRGELAPREKAAWEKHRAACGLCRKLDERWPEAESPARFTAGVLERLKIAESLKPRLAPVWAFRFGWAAAAALLVAAFWHPEKDWIRADRSFASFDPAGNPPAPTMPFLGGERHE